jgi:hypothetical protein
MRRWLAALLAASALASCGDSPDDEPTRRAVSGSVDLEQPQAGAPDAGTARGHGGDVAVASTPHRGLVVRGKLAPPTSGLVLVDGRSRRQAPVAPDQAGRFAAELTGLRPGLNSFRLVASKPGYERWTLELRITRER